MKIDCLEIIENIRNTYDLTERKTLVVIQVGNNPASDLYVKSKIKEAEKWNVAVILEKLESSTTEKLISMITYYNQEPCDGIIVQLPLPDNIDTQRVLDAIDPKKNVDGFKQTNKPQYYEPCTPLGIMMLLKHLKPSLDGLVITLVGRGKTIGEPIRDMLIKENATLITCHSKTKKYNLYNFCFESNVVILATGQANLINCGVLDYKKHPLVIDAGISRINGKQIGDFSHEVIYSEVDYTPWTNGVGKMTVAALMMNVRKDIE